MSKKDFELIARVLRGRYQAATSITDQDSVRSTAQAFAAALRATNPRFDSARFILAIVQ